MTTSGTTTSPIENPEGASLLKQSADMIIRLDILNVQSASGSAMGRIHLRATYEKSDATSETDAYDPQAAALADQFARLQGRSVEFIIEPDGKLSSIIGLEDILSNPSVAQSVRAWMINLSSGAAFPQAGIALGQKWANEQPLVGSPLAGLIWRTESTYLRDEPCRSAAPAGSTSSRGNPAAPAEPSATPQPSATSPSVAASSVAADESCAVILTRVEILRRRSHDDPTPKDYRRNSLSTSGTWTGSGESLDSISLSTGLTIRSTQTSTQDINLTIISTRSGARMNYTAHVESQTEIRLLPGPSAQAQPQTMP
jgi:hypothetical protein